MILCKVLTVVAGVASAPFFFLTVLCKVVGTLGVVGAGFSLVLNAGCSGILVFLTAVGIFFLVVCSRVFFRAFPRASRRALFLFIVRFSRSYVTCLCKVVGAVALTRCGGLLGVFWFWFYWFYSLLWGYSSVVCCGWFLAWFPGTLGIYV